MKKYTAFIILFFMFAAGVPGEEKRPLSGETDKEAFSAPAEKNTIPVPSPPSDIRVSLKAGEVIIEWEEVKGGNAVYEISRSDSADGEFLKINKEPVRSGVYIDNPENSVMEISPGETYYYRVSAVVDGAATPESDTVMIDVTGPLMPPENISTVSDKNSVTLTWERPKSTGEYGISGYNIYREGGPGQGRKVLNRAPVPETKYTDNNGGEGLIEGEKYTYMLQSADVKGNLSDLSHPVVVFPCEKAAAPLNVTVNAVSGESMKISWEEPESGTFEIESYNIFRSTMPSVFPDEPINERPVKPYRDEKGMNYYFDNIINSKTAPETGVVYYYRVAPVDSRGNTGEISAQAACEIEFLELKQSGILSYDISRYGLPPDSKLKLAGMKTIDLVFTNRWYPEKLSDQNDPTNPEKGDYDFDFKIDQLLRLVLNGNIGEKIKVDINYTEEEIGSGADDWSNLSSNRDEDTVISIKYEGEKGETVQEASFGDITLTFPSTKYVSFQETLFGVRTKLSLLNDDLTVTGVFAQTKGITNIQEFTGRLREKEENGKEGKTIYAKDFIRNTYYYLTKDPLQVSYYSTDPVPPDPEVYIKPGSVIIYIDDRLDTNNTGATVSYPSGIFKFDIQRIGFDYTVDYKTGVVRFNRSIGENFIIAAAYETTTDGQDTVERIGYAGGIDQVDFNEAGLHSAQNGYTSDSAHLIQYPEESLNQQEKDLSHKVVSYYYMGETQIYNPKLDTENFDFRVMNETFDEGLPQPWDSGAERLYEIDTDLGIIKFRAFFPFGKDAVNVADPTDPGTQSNDGLYEDAYNVNVINAKSPYRIELRYRYYISSYRLDHPDVVSGSERVYLDDVLLTRDVDYHIFYEVGEITFTDPDRIKPESKIRIIYEYSPFFDIFENNLIGLRADYKIFDNLRLGGTLLLKSSTSGSTVPDARSTKDSLSTPYNMWVADADIKFTLSKENINKIISALPGVENSEIPVDFNFSGEAAYSDFNVNVFSKNDEDGVAMIDNMEGSENIRAAGTTIYDWFPASMPHNMLPENRSYFKKTQTDDEYGHEYLEIGDLASPKIMLKFDYNNITNQEWDAFRYVISKSGENFNNYNFLELWVYVNTNNPVRFTVDVGVVSEDSNGNNEFKYNEKDPFVLHDSEDYDASGVPSYEKDTGISPGIYPQLPADNQSYWGKGNGSKYIDTEDMDGDGILDTAERYYQFTYETHPELQLSGSGWKNIKIPLSEFTRGIGLDPAALDPNNASFMSLIKHIRVYVTGAGAAPSSGHIKIETLQFTGNSWSLRVIGMSNPPYAQDYAGNTIDSPDANKFNIYTVDKNTDSGYVPNTDFFEYQRDEDTVYEKALVVEYNISKYDQRASDNFPIYYATKNLSTTRGYDYSGYRYLKMDVLFDRYDSSAGPGRVLFLRLGAGNDDERRYYQYTAQLDDIPKDGGWHTVEFELDGSDKKRTDPINDPAYLPDLTGVQYLTIGVINPNNISADEKIYINNIRLAEPDKRQGSAKYMNSTLRMAGLGTITHTFEDTDAEFRTLAQINQAQKPKHLRTNSVSFNTDKILFLPPVTNRFTKTESYTEEQFADDPEYYSYPDEIREEFSNYFTYGDIPGITISSNLALANIWQAYPLEYIQPERSNKRRTFTEVLNATWKLPEKLWFIPLGRNDLQGKVTFTDLLEDYAQELRGINDDPMAAPTPYVETVYYDKWSLKRQQYYKWSASYNIWNFTVSPVYEHDILEMKGNLSQSFDYYGDIFDNKNYVGRYLLLTRKINPKVTVSLKDAWIFSPNITYRSSYFRDFTYSRLNTSGEFSFSSGVLFKELFEWLPNISSYSLSVKVNESYDDVKYEDSFERWDSLNFERKWGAFLWQMLGSDAEIKILEEISYSGSMTINHNLSLSDIFMGENFSFTPSGSYTKGRNSSGRAPTTGTETWRFYINNIRLQKFTIPLLDFAVKDETLTGRYDYSVEKTANLQSVGGIKDTIIFTHNASLTLPYRVENGVNGSLGIVGSVKENFGQQGWYETLSLRPSFVIHYAWEIDSPIKLPGWVPFGLGGRQFRLENNIDFNSSISSTWSKTNYDYADDAETFIINFTNKAGYNFLKNVRINTSVGYEFKYDKLYPENKYHKLELLLGVALEF